MWQIECKIDMRFWMYAVALLLNGVVITITYFGEGCRGLFTPIEYANISVLGIASIFYMFTGSLPNGNKLMEVCPHTQIGFDITTITLTVISVFLTCLTIAVSMPELPFTSCAYHSPIIILLSVAAICTMLAAPCCNCNNLYSAPKRRGQIVVVNEV